MPMIIAITICAKIEYSRTASAKRWQQSRLRQPYLRGTNAHTPYIPHYHPTKKHKRNKEAAQRPKRKPTPARDDNSGRPSSGPLDRDYTIQPSLRATVPMNRHIKTCQILTARPACPSRPCTLRRRCAGY